MAKKCVKCGSASETTETVDGDEWCPTCAEGLEVCDHCEDKTDDKLVFVRHSGEHWCIRCSNYLERCPRCGSWMDEKYWVGEAEWCPDCVMEHAVQCAYCHDHIDEDEVHTVHLGDDQRNRVVDMCHDCAAKKGAFVCAHCEEEYVRSCLGGSGEGQEYCRSCADEG